MVRGLVLSSIAALALGAQAALAAVTGITASPNPIAVNDQGSALATVRWTIEVTTSTPATLVSPVGSVVGGPGVETPGRTFQKAVTSLGVSTHRFSERIRISRAAIQALRSGATVTYTRDWSDGGAPTTFVVALQMTSGGALSIRSVDMTFGNDARVTTVGRGEALTAVARVTSAGRGRFVGGWEVSGPTGRSTSAFLPLGRIRQTLAGPRTTVFESPTLPTDRPGTYLVRLSPDPQASGATADLFPTIRYQVLPNDDPATLALGTPEAGARITTSTRFAWAGAPGAEVYRVEFLTSGSVGQTSDARVAAVDVAAPNTTTNVRAFTLARLDRAGARYWRVVAYSSDGRVIASSAPRRIGGAN